MTKRLKKYGILMITSLISGLILLKIANLSLISKPQPIAQNGLLDLTDWDFEKDGTVQLNGEWEFYWNQLLTHEDFKENEPKIHFNGYQQVPNTWDEYNISGKHPKGTGYGTYRLKVKNDNWSDTFGLKILTMSTSYIIMIDDRVIATNGTVGDIPKKTKPKYNTQSVSIIPTSNEFHIIVQVSNFTYARGGIWRPIVFGLDYDIRKITIKTSRNEMFLMGIILIMMCYHFILYCVRKEDKSLLYAVIGLFVTILRILVTGEYYITTLFPNISFSTIILLEYCTLYWGLITWVLFIGKLFPYEFNKNILKIFVFVDIFFTVATFTLPIYIYTNYLICIEIYNIILFIYAILRVIIAAKNEKDDAQLILYCSILLFTAYIIDISIFLNFIPNITGGVFITVVAVAVLIQAYIISRRYSRAMEQSKISEVAMLQAQISPHFLHNAMNALAELSYQGGDVAYDAITSFSEYLRYSYDLLPQSKMISLHKEIELVEAYLKVEKLRFGDKLHYEIYVENSKTIYLPPFMIQPLVENAVRHGVSKKKGGGVIIISGKQEGKLYKIMIEDSGVGISEDVINNLAIGEKTNSMGHGLSNVNKRLINKYNTRLNVIINEHMGTTAYFFLKI
ncbi:sensor histidine kinase [Vallitalea sp.]|jgi:sensor histidine kinase YesM|uniref:sensor histidine kinase n=1 Tax=Vallitalea sp. TaxID=1882829 RepID=UPI0025E935D4|nr:histidine kinase [Vallitalea sp.]MCT4686313.1 histidine kinase [Vallitalea sp.]